MTWWQRLKSRWGRRPDPIRIPTPWGDVTEGARLAAALRMREEPEVKARVESMIGHEEAKRRYPEAYLGAWE